MRTRRGELSVKVAEWELLAEARRNFGDKWRGVTDVETRYRQREVDLWANERTRQLLRLRSDVVRRLRERLWAQGFVEVETPCCTRSRGAPRPARSSPTTTRSTSTSTCASRPSST